MAENKTPEFEPPQACVQRVIKSVLPDNVQIGKDAKAAFSRSAGIFIMYLTACANDFCREAKRQTISAQDVMQAIKELEFGELEEPLKEYLDQYRREASAKKQSKAAMGAAGPAAAKKGEAGGDMMEEPDADDGEMDGAGAGAGDDAQGGRDRAVNAASSADAQRQQQSGAVPGGGEAGAIATPTGMNVERQEPPAGLQGQQPPPPQQPPAASAGLVPMDEDGGSHAAPAPGPAVPAAAGSGEGGVVG
ncbi:unnamed protein product [Ectocarpus sp. 12 AP-2014]